MIAQIGLASLVIVVAMTYWIAGHSNSNGGQSRLSALIEAWINVCVGFFVNFGVNLLVLPLVGASFTSAENFWLGCIYTLVSILRSYAIRLWCADRIHLMAARAAERLA